MNGHCLKGADRNKSTKGSSMKIVIPTYMREDRQIAYQYMHTTIREQVTLVTHSGRAGLLKEKNPGAVIHDLGKTDGIADVRQKILDWVSRTDDKVFILDDGCHFYTSERQGEVRKIAPTAFRGLTGVHHYKRMFYEVEQALDQYPQVGISPRPGNNRHLDDVLSPGRSYSCYGINLKTVNKLGVRFDGMYKKNKTIKLFEDFYFTLSLLTKGVPNAILYNYGFMHNHGKTGGNSTIRTNELQKQCLEALQAEFPQYVKLVQRKAVSWSIGNPDFRWECVIQWKKALTEAINK